MFIESKDSGTLNDKALGITELKLNRNSETFVPFTVFFPLRVFFGSGLLESSAVKNNKRPCMLDVFFFPPTY